MYYIGIDASGSYSRLIGISRDKKIIGRHSGPLINIRNGQQLQIKDSFRRLILEFNMLSNTKPQDCVGICIGLQGIEPMDDSVVFLDEVAKDIGIPVEIRLADEAQMILATVAKNEPGVVIIAGQTSVAYAIDKKGRAHKCGGYGFLVDDGGTTFKMGLEAIKKALMTTDGRATKTIMTDKIKEFYGLKNIKDIEAVFSEFDVFEAPKKISELAVIVKMAAIQNDRAAIEIERSTAQELYVLAKTLITNYGLTSNKVAICGSLITVNDRISKYLEVLVKAEFSGNQVVTIKEKLEMGAASLAMPEFETVAPQ